MKQISYQQFIEKLQSLWSSLPKSIKVAIYMLGAAILDETARNLTPDALTFIPAVYRLAFFNFIEVLLVEGYKYLKSK